MPEPYAELIGDPIGHSLSPTIHNFWLKQLRIRESYRALRVTPDDLPAYFEARRRDMAWRGCNVTAPLKRAVFPFLQALDGGVDNVRAVNCVHPGPNCLVGANTDVEGVAEALASADVEGRRVVIIGGGGGARAAAHHLHERSAADIVMLVREPDRVEVPLFLRRAVRLAPLDAAPAVLEGAAVVINATPLGMAHAPAMPDTILAALDRLAPGAVALDMVYAPLDTPFLAAARAARVRTVDGLVMLLGQARYAFGIFFGADPPPSADAELRRLLLGASTG